MSEYIQVVTTVGQESDAQRIATELVDRRLAACVQVSGPIRSTYRWQGAIETSAEWCCTIKSRLDRYDALETVLRELHPYDTPEIIATRIERGAAKYLAWMEEMMNEEG